MTKIEMLRLLITQRLTAAAEEIFGVFGRAMAEYEEEISRSKLEIDRQRRLLELSVRPTISVQVSSTGLSEQQDWTSAVDVTEAPPPGIKEEDEDEEEGLWLQRDQTPEPKDQFVLNRNNEDHMSGSEPGTSILRSCSDPNEDGLKDPDLVCSGNGLLDGVDPEAPVSEVVDSYICTICGRAFAQRSHWAKHVQVHRKADAKADKSFVCDICGKRLTRFDGYQKHLRVHTGEKPYTCHECGRRFSDNSNYKRHIRTHTGQKTQS
ncbi:zinc finger protein 316-like [Sphaeramia orbicularis]|uniref:zinc finger protein 316-like n=1 Tax=Sphaeramia orbicularis TaxID=375764 RepID=UPI00117F0A5F|nr:zinc finger protein 316-like [Sphaeramia orbicularis]